MQIQWIIVGVAAGLVSCSPPVPKWREVDRLEQLLAKEACIGPLSEWDRKYFYKLSHPSGYLLPPPRNPYVVGFIFDEAGVGDYRSVRRLGSLEDFMIYDHAQRKYASGDYDIRTGRLVMSICATACGPSVPAGDSCG